MIRNSPAFGICSQKQSRKTAIRETSRLQALVHGRQIIERVVMIARLVAVKPRVTGETHRLRRRILRRYLPNVRQMPKCVSYTPPLLSGLTGNERGLASMKMLTTPVELLLSLPKRKLRERPPFHNTLSPRKET